MFNSICAWASFNFYVVFLCVLPGTKMKKLSSAQQSVYNRLSKTEPKCAYVLMASLPTLRAMCKKGICKDVTKPGPGGMFSPRTHFKFIAK